jgi:hypothetical protein
MSRNIDILILEWLGTVWHEIMRAPGGRWVGKELGTGGP